jgi:hypothetical protein
MSLLHNSKHKLKNVQRTIDALLDGDFPLGAGRNALLKLRDVFTELDHKIDRANRLKDADTLRQLASNINLKIYQALPILGFILRSTNVRNAFELLDPLQAIASAALQGKPQLLLSSEWDYVPFAYPQSLEDLRSFVLIGLPASEAASALLLPLAGHEIGHAVWRNLGIEGSVASTLQYRCVDLYSHDLPNFQKIFPDYDSNDMVSRDILPSAIGESVDYGVRQAEEIFCDLFAYAIFGASYVYAFAYIVAPGSGGLRDPNYPSHATRISVVSEMAAAEGVNLPSYNQLDFANETGRGDSRHRYVVRKAEDSVVAIKQGVWNRVLEIVQKSKLHRPSETMAIRHLKEFGIGIPAHQPVCLGDIVNAGWLRYDEIVRSVRDARNASEEFDNLNEILLKTVEVLEYLRRVSS